MDSQKYIGLSKRILANGNYANVDFLYGPYSSVSEALKAVPYEYRTLGRTVGITINGTVKEYWFETGVEDANLVLNGFNYSDYEKTLTSYATKAYVSEALSIMTDGSSSTLTTMNNRITALETSLSTASAHSLLS